MFPDFPSAVTVGGEIGKKLWSDNDFSLAKFSVRKTVTATNEKSVFEAIMKFQLIGFASAGTSFAWSKEQ